MSLRQCDELVADETRLTRDRISHTDPAICWRAGNFQLHALAEDCQNFSVIRRG